MSWFNKFITYEDVSVLFRFTRKTVNIERNKINLSVCLFIKSVHSGYFAFIPENLDIDAHLSQYPLVDYGNFSQKDGVILSSKNLRFDKDKLIYLIGLISSIPARNKDSITESGYVIINASYLQGFFKDYVDYLDYLIGTGVFVSDNHYIPGVKSKGYKFGSEYESVDLKKYSYSRFEGKIEQIEESVYNEEVNEFEHNYLSNCPYLAHWYNEKGLKINWQKADQYSKQTLRKKLDAGESAWNTNKNTGKKKNPTIQYYAAKHNIEAIKVHDYKAKIDTNVHRLHSVLTNIEKDYRNFTSYEDQDLVSIDITNSQPYLMNILYNPEFWKEDSTSDFSIKDLPDNIKALINTSLSIMIGNVLSEISITNLNDYRDKTSQGQIYEHIRDLSNARFNLSLERGDIKTMFYIVLFSKNRFYHQPKARLKRLFSELYPDAYKLVETVKSQNHATLACLLQAIESQIILHRCCKRIWEEGNGQIPIFTIHDSIVTTFENQAFVKNIMEEELTKAVGLPPTLTVEQWSEVNLKHQDILAQINESIAHNISEE